MKLFIGKKTNKILIGAFLGTAILGLGGYGMSPKGKGFFNKLKGKIKSICGFFLTGFNEIVNKTKNLKPKK